MRMILAKATSKLVAVQPVLVEVSGTIAITRVSSIAVLILMSVYVEPPCVCSAH